MTVTTLEHPASPAPAAYRWSEAEVALVRRYYDRTMASARAVSAMLEGRRSAGAVHQEARKLGLTRLYPSTRHLWTLEEDLRLRRDITPSREERWRLAKRMGVTLHQLEYRAAQLGVLSATDYGQRVWTLAEDERLRKLVGKVSVKAIAERLGRSTNAVAVRMKRLGLKRRYREGWYTATEACELLGVDHKWLRARVDSGALRASYHHGQQSSAGGTCMWHIERGDLREFVRRHCQELNGRNMDMVGMVELLAGVLPGRVSPRGGGNPPGKEA